MKQNTIPKADNFIFLKPMQSKPNCYRINFFNPWRPGAQITDFFFPRKPHITIFQKSNIPQRRCWYWRLRMSQGFTKFQYRIFENPAETTFFLYKEKKISDSKLSILPFFFSKCIKRFKVILKAYPFQEKKIKWYTNLKLVFFSAKRRWNEIRK